MLPTGQTPLALTFPLPDSNNIHTSPALEIIQYMANRIPGSTTFFTNGLPLDITDVEIKQYLITIEDHLQIAVDINRNRHHIRQQLNQNSIPTRLPNVTFSTILYMGPEAATFTYGFYHGNRQWLALRIIPNTYKRPYATSSSRQSGYLTSYVLIHPSQIRG